MSYQEILPMVNDEDVIDTLSAKKNSKKESKFLVGLMLVMLAVSSFAAGRFSHQASAVSASTLNSQVSVGDACGDNIEGLEEVCADPSVATCARDFYWMRIGEWEDCAPEKVGSGDACYWVFYYATGVCTGAY